MRTFLCILSLLMSAAAAHAGIFGQVRGVVHDGEAHAVVRLVIDEKNHEQRERNAEQRDGQDDQRQPVHH